MKRNGPLRSLNYLVDVALVADLSQRQTSKNF